MNWVTQRQAGDPRETARVLAGNPQPVRVVAICDRFQVGGQPATVGEIYTVDADIAAGLVALGKVKLA